jgi:hypothetical protein
MYLDRLAQFYAACTDAVTSGLNFLAHEDVALKAYRDTRRRYLSDVEPARVFNQIGEVLPTIAYHGQLVGTWAWDPKQLRVTYKLIRGRTTQPQQAEINKHATRISAVLRQGHR